MHFLIFFNPLHTDTEGHGIYCITCNIKCNPEMEENSMKSKGWNFLHFLHRVLSIGSGVGVRSVERDIYIHLMQKILTL